ncbi:H-2 class I histocompatibility antigen, Q9 alpha chain-like isoform X3 [Sceloporus undulatus]|uniref:H-2 class I histocompatibility antigen, Q9 alpha chain-like isoform X3 n=1 Tax=Sceloporus undulatus TaxID=8520 RepID=UPI001C4CB2BA|nr:H-2 class I histocompatibility antigen, Q9 alpha chain-like isoform X3 [Sceloporus undulatus]
MAPSPSVLLLALASFLLLLLLGSSLASHSLRYFYTGVTGSSQGLPQFSIVGYVDGQPIFHYDSDTKQALRKASWMEKAGEEDPEYWDRQTQLSQNTEQVFKENLVDLAKYYNQSGGFHTWQWMYGCELRKDGSKGGYQQYAYDGKDYISFDKDTLTWTAADLPAQNTKRKWDPDSAFNQAKKAYLEETCIEWLQRYLEYGKEELRRTDPPEVKVARKAGYDNMETLICRVDGFYPKDIDISWRKDGKDWIEDTFSGLVSPNSDGTYYKWLSVEIDPKDRERYKCHVEHDGLPDPVDLAWEEPASNLGLIVACVMGAVLLVAGIAGIVWIAVYIKKRQDGYKAPSDSDQGSNSSGRASTAPI